MISVRTFKSLRFQRAWAIVELGLLIDSERDYDRAVALLDYLLDLVDENQQHPLFGFLDVLGTMIETYEEDHIKIAEPKSLAASRGFLKGMRVSSLREKRDRI